MSLSLTESHPLGSRLTSANWWQSGQGAWGWPRAGGQHMGAGSTRAREPRALLAWLARVPVRGSWCDRGARPIGRGRDGCWPGLRGACGTRAEPGGLSCTKGPRRAQRDDLAWEAEAAWPHWASQSGPEEAKASLQSCPAPGPPPQGNDSRARHHPVLPQLAHCLGLVSGAWELTGRRGDPPPAATEATATLGRVAPSLCSQRALLPGSPSHGPLSPVTATGSFHHTHRRQLLLTHAGTGHLTFCGTRKASPSSGWEISQQTPILAGAWHFRTDTGPPGLAPPAAQEARARPLRLWGAFPAAVLPHSLHTCTQTPLGPGTPGTVESWERSEGQFTVEGSLGHTLIGTKRSSP